MLPKTNKKYSLLVNISIIDVSSAEFKSYKMYVVDTKIF